MNARTWFYSTSFHSAVAEPAAQPQPSTVPVERWDAAQNKWITVMVPNPEIANANCEDDDEDPPCECYYIAADVADASLCRVHGGAR